MNEVIKKSPFSMLLSYGYTIVIRLPLMFVGYYKDSVALSKRLNDSAFNDLRLEGLHIFSEAISSDEIKALIEDFENLKKSRLLEKSGQLTGRIFSHGVLSPLLSQYVEKIKPYAATFFNAEEVRVEISYYQESYPQIDLESVPGGDFHVDDNKANLKYFIYLSDVGERNGPFSCVPSTGSWRLPHSIIRGILWELTSNRKYHYGYLLNQAKCMANEKIITGAAGTHFLVDTTTVHRAQPVKEGFRKVAVISFNRL